MSPKPPIRILAKPPSAAKSKVVSYAKEAPRAPPKPPRPHAPSSRTTTPSLLPPPRWYENPRIRSSVRFAAWSTNVVVGLCALIWVRDHYVKLDRVRGSSMAPTLSPETHETGRVDWVILRPYTGRSAKQQKTTEPRDEGNVRRGDVITFWKPHKPEEMGIKRVVAVEGDTVYPTRGYALDPAARGGRIQGLPDGLPDRDEDAIQVRGEETGKVVVPYGHVWVEGDNWRKSYDSNDFGPISKGLIEGRAVWVWRSWFEFLRVGDGRNKREENMRSRVVEGRSEIPAMFLE